MKETPKEVLSELVEDIFALINREAEGKYLMLKPIIKIAKKKIDNLSDKDSEKILDSIHKLSYEIECKTGDFSKYHYQIENDDSLQIIQ